jgi:hypothetical protein
MRVWHLLPGLLLFCSCASASIKSDIAASATATATSVVGTTLSRPDVAFSRTLITPHILRGNLGERVMAEFLLPQLDATGSWIPVPSQFGPHGLDGVYIEFRNGQPSEIFVAESKYGTAKLSDGQMTANYVAKNLTKVAARYGAVREALFADNVSLGKAIPPKGAPHVVKVHLANGEVVTFWRESTRNGWKCDRLNVPKEAVGQALSDTERNINSAAADPSKVGRFVYRTRITADQLIMEIHPVVGERNGNVVLGAPTVNQLVLTADDLANLKTMTALEIRRVLYRKAPHLTSDHIDNLAEKIVQGQKLDDVLAGFGRKQLYSQFGMSSLKTAGIGGILAVGGEALGQFLSDGQLDASRLGKVGALGLGATGLGTASGQVVTLAATKAGTLNSVARQVGLGSTRFGGQILGGTSGGIVTTVAFAYGGLAMGLYDLQTANLLAGTGATGVVASLAVAPGLMWAAGTFGVASTGTAISTLSGAAATNASLAWLGSGGGLLASGTVAGGTIVIGAATLGVAVVVGAVATGCVAWYYNSYDQARLEATLAVLLDAPYYQAFPPPLESAHLTMGPG